MSENVMCIAEFIAKPDMLEKLLLELGKLISPTRQEAGCLHYAMHVSLENPNLVMLLERFKDQDAFAWHLQTVYVRHFVDTVMPALVEEVKFGTYSEI